MIVPNFQYELNCLEERVSTVEEDVKEIKILLNDISKMLEDVVGKQKKIQSGESQTNRTRAKRNK